MYFEALSKREKDKRHDGDPTADSMRKQRSLLKLKLQRIRSKRKQSSLVYFTGIAVAASLLTFFVHFHFIGEIEPLPGQDSTAEIEITAVINQDSIQINKPKTSNRHVKLVTASGRSMTLDDLKAKEQTAVQGFHLSKDEKTLIYSQEKSKKTDSGINTLIVERGAEFCITLNDGTKVWLNAESKLEYPSTFSENERRVRITGEAYFDVAEDATRPFIVSTRSMDVRVFGTEFNINTRKDECIRTTLISGSVSVKSPGSEEIKLTPGFTVELNPLTGQMDINDNDIHLYIGWKTGQYLFEQIKLVDLLNELAIWYDLTIDYQTQIANNETFTGSLTRNLSVGKLIKLIERTNYIVLELKGKRLIVKEKVENSNVTYEK